MAEQSREANYDQDFVEITSEDGRLRSYWDKEADAAFTHLETAKPHWAELTADDRKILEFNQEGELVGVQFLYCSDGITMDDVPEEVREQAVQTARRLGITVREG